MCIRDRLKPETLTDLVEIIRPEMFYTRQNAQIYSEMLRLFTSDQTIDFVTLLDAVISDGVFPSADEAKVYLTGLAETVPSISNVKAYAQIVQEKYLVRQLMGVAKDILQDAGVFNGKVRLHVGVVASFKVQVEVEQA